MKPLALLLLLLVTSCSSIQKVKSTSSTITTPRFDQKTKLQIVRQDPHATFAYMTLRESEKLHVHDNHDVTAYVLQDGGTMHFSDKLVPLKMGELIVIPKKTEHFVSFPKGMMARAFLVITPKINENFKRYLNRPDF
jgi:mannose-6-phosphate isomerase-like protein (cupin superfamily)